MKISKKSILILLGFIGVLSALGTYVFVYQNLMTKAQNLQNENLQLSSQVTEIEILEKKVDFYTEETGRMNAEILLFYQKFPSLIKEEDTIMLSTYLEAYADNMNISTLSFGTPEFLYETTLNPEESSDETESNALENEVVEDNEEENSDIQVIKDLELYRLPVSMSFQVSYTGLKDLIRFVYDQPNHMGIDTLSLTFDDASGVLSGNTSINMYTLIGTNNPYLGPIIPDIPRGVGSIFGAGGTVETPETTSNETTEGVQQGTDETIIDD